VTKLVDYSAVTSSSDAGPFDPEALRTRYAEERRRRLRSDGISQYVETSGAFSRFGADPWADPGFTREPIADSVDVAVVGAGFGGLLIGARCKQLGVDSVRLIDKAADVGGTWYWNRYPGIACDVESYVYMPLLEELGYIPTEKYAKGPEILAHCRRIAEHFDLYRNACLQTEVQEIRWEADSCRWVITTDRGDEIRARFVAMANGYLQKPKLPGIDGITNFTGHTFHTSRWDYEYTGSDLSGLSDQRVGIIGTGATAIQCVPRLAEAVHQLFVFQRTPSTVDVRANRPTEPQWAASLEPGWQQRRMRNFQILTAGGTSDEDLVDDAWTSLTRADGVRTLHGVHVNGFANCFIESIAQSGFTVNFPYLIDTQSRHIAWVIAWALQHGAAELEATADAEAAWVDTVVQRSSVIAGRRQSCTPGYYNREGRADARLNQDSFFFGSPTEYADLLETSRSAGTLAGLDVRQVVP
jgi:thioredoxin reductase